MVSVFFSGRAVFVALPKMSLQGPFAECVVAAFSALLHNVHTESKTELKIEQLFWDFHSRNSSSSCLAVAMAGCISFSGDMMMRVMMLDVLTPLPTRS